ncbi:MvdC/MvdD family ATP grasp protein [Nocardiopsis rhodophaea]|uniref:MvdC/MvdD family ATP grasp protein n=1 Tax=Nocardiopsis rhodophaea TaxID=280238 RepID=UPI00337FB413
MLVLAASDDGEARQVAGALRRQGHPVAWLDLAWFPTRVSVAARLGPMMWEGSIDTPEGRIDLADVAAVYYRHLAPFEMPEEMSEPERRFATVEARFGLGGILSSLPARWVSHPSAVADTEYKPVQLAAAAREGFAIPATWLGNAIREAQSFTEQQPSGAVYKAIMHKIISEEGAVKAIYTSPADPSAIDERVSLTMHQLQARVRDARDVRALVTRGGCEAVEITYADGFQRLDYRGYYDTVAYRRIQLDDKTVMRCQRLLAALGLRLGVFDFALTDAGDVLIYEVNPAGQWAWLEEETGAPMTGLVVDELTGAAE